MRHAFVVPWRDRGTDDLRPANLAFIQNYLKSLNLGGVIISGDSREGAQKFCRHAAYNTGGGIAFRSGATVVTFYESDMIVPRLQLVEGIRLAGEATGLVVPFDRYEYMSPEDSERIRAQRVRPGDCKPEHVMVNGKSIGAVNILSQASIEAVGQWDTIPDGNGFDDNMMHRAFEVCCGPTRYVKGPGRHLFHRPAWYGLSGAVVSPEDRAATRRNKVRLHKYKMATTPERIRELTAGGS